MMRTKMLVIKKKNIMTKIYLFEAKNIKKEISIKRKTT